MENITRAIIADTLRAADAGDAVRRADLAADLEPELVSNPPIAILSIGKASLSMGRAAHESLGDRILHSFATTVPEHARDPLWTSLPGEVFACDHPLPTQRNVEVTLRLKQWVRALPPNAVLVVLLSGGASAHLCSPAEGLTLDDIVHATRTLQQAGADIHELNCIRRHCETLKGGGLARLAAPRRIVTYIISDVIGNQLPDIGSGPTVPDPTSTIDAISLTRRYRLAHLESVFLHRAKQPRLNATHLSNSRVRVIAANRDVVQLLHALFRHIKVRSVETLPNIEASVPEVAEVILKHAHLMAPRSVFILGGEWTVDTRNAAHAGIGGPSQELALTIAHKLKLPRPWAFLTLSTDGRDGPTDHAGAVVTHETAALARARGVNLADALARHDSTPTLAALNCLITTGPTGTNLNHIAVLLI